MIIYKTTCLLDYKSYVGKDEKNNDKYFGSGIKLIKAINKYGIENFRKDILQFCNSREELNELEKFWIKLLKTKDRRYGYNIAAGGHGGFIGYHSKETKLKMSNTAKLAFKNGTRNLSGMNNPMYGKIGINCPNYGMIRSEETKEKQRQNNLGENNPMYGKIQSKKSRKIKSIKGKLFYAKKRNDIEQIKQLEEEYNNVRAS